MVRRGYYGSAQATGHIAQGGKICENMQYQLETLYLSAEVPYYQWQDEEWKRPGDFGNYYN
jgi:hypothetical protein